MRLRPWEGRIGFVLAASAVTFAFLLLLRAAFFVVFRGSSPGSEEGALLGAVLMGARFDLRLALLLALPALLGSWSLLDPGRTVRARRIWLGYFGAAWLAVAFVHVVDFCHYEYLQARIDASVTEHLVAPDIALEMVLESYPVGGLLLALGALVGLYLLVLWSFTPAPRPAPARTAAPQRALSFGLALLLFAGGIYGRAARYPLRWSDAYATQDAFATALALNPVLHLAETWRVRGRGPDLELVRERYGEVAAYLGVDEPDVTTLALGRRVAGAERAPWERPPNVVIVICESFSAFKVGAFGNPLDPTPRFDALAEEGLLFTRFFVPSGPTARSVFSALTSIPDVHAGTTASRDPLAVSQRTLVNEFAGYEKLYFLGGSASWGNVRGVLQHNVPDLRLYEEGDYDAPHGDVWGISDLDLVREANAVLRGLGPQPFLAIVQTSGNHRPWTIPADEGGFRRSAPVEDDVLRAHGFDELQPELDAMRFLDHALGELIELARREEYFRDTLFLFFGDHGTAFPGEHPPLPGLTSHHVPFLIYGPPLAQRGRVDTPASSLDVLPTAAGLAGLEYSNHSLGRDLFDGARERQPFVFLRFGERCGLVGEELLLEHAPDGSRRLFRYRSEDPRLDVSADLPAEAERMGRLAEGLQETARYLLFRGR